MGVVSDDTVVAGFLNLVGDDDRARICHALADLGHGFVLVLLHLAHALLCLLHESSVFIILILFHELSTLGEGNESLTLLSSSGLVI